MDFLQELGYLGLTIRLKRITDKFLQDGKKMYQTLGWDIEPNQVAILLALETKGTCSITQLAEMLQIAHPSVVAMVKKLKDQGYISYQNCADDKRQRAIGLTELAHSKMGLFKSLWMSGTTSIYNMTNNSNLLEDLRTLESNITQGGFNERTLNHFKQVKVNDGNIVIQSFDAALAPYFAQLNFEWLHMYFVVEPHDNELLLHPKQYIIDKGGEIFFAIINGIVVGTVALVPTSDPATFELAKMAVSPIYKGKGIGKMLMEKAIAFAKSKDLRALMLESNRRLTTALALYEKYGFKEIAPDPNTPYTRCDIKMELEIS